MTAVNPMKRFVQHIGELRAVLAFTVLVCIALYPFSASEIRYTGWGFVPDVIAPVLSLLLVFGLLLDMLMSRVFMFDVDKTRRGRFKLIIVLEVLLLAGLLTAWGPFYLALLNT